jgi:hypothetical protein
MQSRIYTYKITFEEVPYYYYGSKKEKYFNEEYWGSPYTHKLCWELYTPKKQILELFDFTDEGYKKCREIEDRLIKPVLNDPWCLNENCGGNLSLKVCKENGTKTKELGVGIHTQTVEQRREMGKKLYERRKGIHALTPQQRSENSKKNKQLGLGIFALTTKERMENGIRGGKIGGKIGGKKTGAQRWKCLVTGYISNPGGLSTYQKARGIDTTKRVRLE